MLLAVGCAVLLLAVLFSAACDPDAPIGRDLALFKTGVASSDGHSVTYTLFVTGTDGPTRPDGSPATPNLVSFTCPVIVTDALPQGATVVSASGSGWTCAGASCVQSTCASGQSAFLSPGGLPPITLVVTVPQQGDYQNCATLTNGSTTGGWAETSLTNNTSCVTVNVPPAPPGRDIAIQKLAQLSADGQTITYTILVTGANGGAPLFTPNHPEELTILCPLTITDVLPPGLTLASTTSTSGGWWTNTGPTTHMAVACAFLGYPFWGGGGVFTILLNYAPFPALTIVANVTQAGTFQNCATVMDDSVAQGAPEANIANNTACVTTTIAPGAITVQAVLDGALWTGPLTFAFAGPQSLSGASAPQTFSTVAPGTYALTVTSGGPPNATLINTTPSTSQAVLPNGAVTYTLNYRTNKPEGGTLNVQATLDGAPWSGPLAYSLTGPQTGTGTSVPQSSLNVSAGGYTLAYNGGGPVGAGFAGITPAPTQTVTPGGAVTFTLDFKTRTVTQGAITVQATLDGSPWTGAVNFTAAGAQTVSGTAVPQTTANVQAGSYTLTYTSGGPANATFNGVAPSATLTLSPGGGAIFTLEFKTNPVTQGTVIVNAMLDGAPWTGAVSFNGMGTGLPTISGASAPQTYGSVPAGTYAFAYTGGGPANASFAGITPAATQTLAGSGTVTYTLNFRTKEVLQGTIIVNAIAAGAAGNAAWTGPVSYALAGPQGVSGTSVSQTFTNMPVGTYTLTYTSGGPSGVMLFSVTPSASQTVTAGGTTTFTLKFQ